MQTIELLRTKMISVFSIPVSSYYIVDSFSLAVCKFGRAPYCKIFRSSGADYGKCSSKKETYYGYKVHVLIILEGYITSFDITLASTDDRKGLYDLTDGWSNISILADKGYVGEGLKQELKKQSIGLFTLKRSNSNTSIDIQVEKKGRNCILTAKWAIKCGKSACQKFSRALYPLGQ